MNWLIDRLKERSSWIAIFTFAGLFGIKLEPEFREAIINAILAVAAVAAFVFREKTHESHQPDHAPELPDIELMGRISLLEKRDVDLETRKMPVDPRGPIDYRRDVERVRASMQANSEPKQSDGWNG